MCEHTYKQKDKLSEI